MWPPCWAPRCRRSGTRSQWAWSPRFCRGSCTEPWRKPTAPSPWHRLVARPASTTPARSSPTGCPARPPAVPSSRRHANSLLRRRRRRLRRCKRLTLPVTTAAPCRQPRRRQQSLFLLPCNQPPQPWPRRTATILARTVRRRRPLGRPAGGGRRQRPRSRVATSSWRLLPSVLPAPRGRTSRQRSATGLGRRNPQTTPPRCRPPAPRWLWRLQAEGWHRSPRRCRAWSRRCRVPGSRPRHPLRQRGGGIHRGRAAHARGRPALSRARRPRPSGLQRPRPGAPPGALCQDSAGWPPEPPRTARRRPSLAPGRQAPPRPAPAATKWRSCQRSPRRLLASRRRPRLALAT
mmetsp:Transcript_22790/g.70678  ORF Transcript_22790/g.70678 Transcript_22790/m.70678 type:complete len:347 (-) Transcript_22790:16-1056(-)